ncbi:MAG: hypothetical protein HY646_15660 [Acidobacteria bacterium]|nr:hypothetical protein [Acidobacteriota bacterium]
MRRVVLFFAVLGVASAAHAQPAGPARPGGSVVTMPAMPVVYPAGYSTSAFDRQGNLLVMDVMYSYSTPQPAPGAVVIRPVVPTMKTRVTVVTNVGNKLPSREYDGSFQVIGVGRNAVYAIVNAYALTPVTTVTRTDGGTTATIAAATRRLVSLKFGGAGAPASLPSLDVPLRAEVKVSAADESNGLDTIALVDAAPAPRILLPADMPVPMPVVQPAARTVTLYKSDGNSFMPVTPNPVPLP